MRASYDSTLSSVAHPHLQDDEFVALQTRSGWSLPVELIASEAVMLPPSGADVSWTRGELLHALRSWQARAGDGGLLLQRVFVHLDAESVFAPDLAWWPATRRPVVGSGCCNVAPSLVAEILAPGTCSNVLGPKRHAYLGAGVRELWLLDPQTRTASVISAAVEDAQTCLTLRSEQLPGFEASVRALFA